MKMIPLSGHFRILNRSIQTRAWSFQALTKRWLSFQDFCRNVFKSQRGCFTVHKIPDMNNDFIPMEESQSASKLKKYIIPKTKKKGIRIQLNTLGFNESTIFPDLDGVCRQLTWKATNTNYTPVYCSGVKHGKAGHALPYLLNQWEQSLPRSVRAVGRITPRPKRDVYSVLVFCVANPPNELKRFRSQLQPT